jgi:hypothetical protein
VNHAKNAWFFLPDKKNMQKHIDFSSRRGQQNHVKSAWVFSPDEKTHATVLGFFYPKRPKPCEKCIVFFARRKKHAKVNGFF